uniref:ZP domain-containing protein n=1 Tax=Meloidogyne hapla TaxID=6305 RepID=A0A1I8BGZ9_MELHA
NVNFVCPSPLFHGFYVNEYLLSVYKENDEIKVICTIRKEVSLPIPASTLQNQQKGIRFLKKQ